MMPFLDPVTVRPDGAGEPGRDEPVAAGTAPTGEPGMQRR
jgi:hypothetical protein